MTKVYSGLYYSPYYKYCSTCKVHHLRWRIKKWRYEDRTVIDKRKLKKCPS